MLCQNCPKRDRCTELCKKAARYVNQDEVGERESAKSEMTLNLLNMHVKMPGIAEVASYFTGESVNFPFLSDLDNKLLQMNVFSHPKMSYAKIAKTLSGGRAKTKLNQTQIRGRIYRAKCKIRDFFEDYKEELLTSNLKEFLKLERNEDEGKLENGFSENDKDIFGTYASEITEKIENIQYWAKDTVESRCTNPKYFYAEDDIDDSEYKQDSYDDNK